MTKLIYRFLGKRFISQMIFLMTLQQIVVALETACLGLIGQSLNQKDKLIIAFIFYFLLTIIPNAIGVLIKKTEMQGYFKSYFNFINNRMDFYQGKSRFWSNKNDKERFLTSIGSEAENYLTAASFSFFDIYLFVTTIVFNLIAVSIVVDKTFLISFLISAIITSIIYKSAIKKVDQIVEIEQESKMQFLNILLKSWDNLFINNKQVVASYKENLQDSYKKTHSYIGRSHMKSESLVFILSLVNIIPLLITTIYLVINHIDDAAYLAGIALTMPKQIQILNNYKNFLNQLTSLRTYSNRFKSYWKQSHLDDIKLTNRIHIHKLNINDSTYQTIAHFEQHIKCLNSGRMTIKGENGSGKSSLLLYLSESLPESIYLSPSPHLEIIEKNNQVGSTGENMIKHLQFLKSLKAPYYLLDEWDANLDKINTDLINDLIDELSKTSIVIEIRH